MCPQAGGPHDANAPHSRAQLQIGALVRCFAQRETSPSSPPIAQELVGSLEHILSLDFCDPTIHNYPQGRRPFNLGLSCSVPMREMRALPASADTCCHSASSSGRSHHGNCSASPRLNWLTLECDATAVMGSWVAELWQKLAECRTFSERITVASETLLMFVNAVRPLTSTMSTVHRLRPSPEPVRIKHVARDSAMSVRSYERQFAGEMGMSPKSFARLARFARAIDLKRSGEGSWLNISHDLGYFDQMHMSKDFQIFGGDAPGRLVRPDSDFQPWSIRSQFRTTEEERVIRKP